MLRPRRVIPFFAVLLAALTSLAAANPCLAQYSADKPLGAAAQNKPSYLQNAGIDQRLGTQLPLNAQFIDSTGKAVTLGDYFHQRPVVLAEVYFKCGMLCPQVLHGMAQALRQTGFHPGDEYDILVTSIDPDDTPADAAEAKAHIATMLGTPGAADHVHFLTGRQPAIDALASATGFHFVRVPGPDGKMDQFAHSSVIMIATPDGRLSKYFSGIEYQPRDLRLALIEASNRRIGSLSDIVLLYCCSYSPSQGRYTVAVLRILGIAGMGSILAMGAVFYLLSRKPRPVAA
ncbi:SCO family protein [Silvibacterium dinghuense]|uniref:SCO family protein n=1 Tax=Silvibacterium dinghuense TaxID=1560006 RepID=A0A4Q1SD30_9BACT|nr:SCO family protein [Silvibacterium dinghuense]RXS94965.1 SCO family protein [Silvibacterium dinghuense]